MRILAPDAGQEIDAESEQARIALAKTRLNAAFEASPPPGSDLIQLARQLATGT